MATLFEMVDYFLKVVTEVPWEVSWTSQIKKWGIPSKSDSFQGPIMTKVVLKDINKRGANPTLCDPRNKLGNINISCKLEKLETSSRKQYKQIVFSHCITSVQERPLTNSMFDNFYFGSPLSYHHQPFKHTTCIPRWNEVETLISTLFHSGIQLVCL